MTFADWGIVAAILVPIGAAAFTVSRVSYHVGRLVQVQEDHGRRIAKLERVVL